MLRNVLCNLNDVTSLGICMNQESAIEAALRQIRKAYGKESITRFGEQVTADVSVIPTGSIGLDLALGIGGLPRGRIVEIYGPESSGKTTLACHVIANAQAMGDVCAFIDVEHAFDPTYAKKIGMKVEDLLFSQPDTGEQALEITDTLVRSGVVKVVVVDSVAALVPKAELEGDMGDSHMGLQARLMSQALRKLTGSIAKSNCLVIFINQIRQKIGVFFGNPETTTGGNALKFYCSVRLDIRRLAQIKQKDTIIGNQTRVKVVKNKLAPPFRVVDFIILYGKGVSRLDELLDFGAQAGFVSKSGGWYAFNETRLGNGRDAARAFLAANPDIAKQIEAKVCAQGAALLAVAEEKEEPEVSEE